MLAIIFIYFLRFHDVISDTYFSFANAASRHDSTKYVIIAETRLADCSNLYICRVRLKCVEDTYALRDGANNIKRFLEQFACVTTLKPHGSPFSPLIII